ncbi:DUF1203 domain-containing protein [Janthinobacterium sp. BJB1]|uniref:DUF1203 domain-containing protein n=1 Tax=Janthinobacterium sp. GW458P TaxID=1981504 RepID=UPI000A32815F|nr:DUF1203 domain-containing protein [Janthinobacterium sp. GW458P]MBE3027712.1 DUF1203 domain-containing protein [Janthinobacterium sp. GW458P]PHV15129.1 DUF1203 domain-containing protein [Janthinobacterium sp. BJB303]PJC97010.1 DUF1203 domain-containing protein [Janthinobacterium sp. BJB1]
MDFRITGLSPEPFLPFFALSDAELAARGMRRHVVDQHPGFPDRIEMVEAALGETVLLLNHVCQPAMTPYRACHAIFVREGATQAYDAVNQVPESMRLRLLSLRAYCADGMMLDAEVVEGTAIEAVIARLFGNADVSYIHVHNAKRGCYAGRIDRVGLSLA